MTATTTAAPTTSTPEPPATTTLPASTVDCSPSQLTVSSTHLGVFVGFETIAVTVTDEGDAACALSAESATLSGHRLDEADGVGAKASSAISIQEPGDGIVLLRPAKSATSEIVSEGECFTTTSSVAYAALVLDEPGLGRYALPPTDGVTQCGPNTISVTPWSSGSSVTFKAPKGAAGDGTTRAPSG